MLSCVPTWTFFVCPLFLVGYLPISAPLSHSLSPTFVHPLQVSFLHFLVDMRDRKSATELQVQCRWQVVHVTIRNNARRAVLYTLSLSCNYFMLLHIRHIQCSEFRAVGACRKNPTELQVQSRWQVPRPCDN